MVILASVCFALFFVLNGLNKTFHVDVKPFNCIPCLSAWTALVLFIMPDYIINFTLYIFGSGVLGMIAYRLMIKL
jgi:hypothetical protein